MLALRTLYRFKPGRTFAQALAAVLLADGTGILDTQWQVKLSVSGMAGLVSLLQIWSEGGDLLAEDTRVTGSKPSDPEPVSDERLRSINLPADGVTRTVEFGPDGVRVAPGDQPATGWVDEREGGDPS